MGPIDRIFEGGGGGTYKNSMIVGIFIIKAECYNIWGGGTYKNSMIVGIFTKVPYYYLIGSGVTVGIFMCVRGGGGSVTGIEGELDLEVCSTVSCAI